jgi:dihydropteroate synthase
MASDSHNPPDARVRELEAEVSRLREQRDAIVENGVTSTFNLALELSEAQAENARLREALRTIAGHAGTWQAHVAREALEAGER